MITKEPLISVIVPCYNYAHFLPRLFDSLCAQTYTNWECIIVDNDSPDNTKNVVETYSLKDARIKYVFQKNGGPASARNTGVLKAQGAYIQFLDADDFIAENKFKIEIELFRANQNSDIVYSDYYFFDADSEKQWNDNEKWETLSDKPFNDFIKFWENGLMIPIHSFLFKKSCFEKFGAFDLNFKTHEDWDLHLNFSLNGLNYFYHEYKGAFYVIHSKSSSRSNLTQNRLDTLNVLSKYLYHPKIIFSKKVLIINRYCEFFIDFLIEKVKYRRIELKTIFRNNGGVLINFLALVLSPFYFFKKITYKIVFHFFATKTRRH